MFLLERVAPALVAHPHLAAEVLLLESELRRLGLGHGPRLLYNLLAHHAGVRPRAN